MSLSAAATQLVHDATDLNVNEEARSTARHDLLRRGLALVARGELLDEGEVTDTIRAYLRSKTHGQSRPWHQTAVTATIDLYLALAWCQIWGRHPVATLLCRPPLSADLLVHPEASLTLEQSVLGTTALPVLGVFNLKQRRPWDESLLVEYRYELDEIVPDHWVELTKSCLVGRVKTLRMGPRHWEVG